jgi:hypothetical protein
MASGTPGILVDIWCFVFIPELYQNTRRPSTSVAAQPRYGITISCGGLAQVYQRMAGKLKGEYEGLQGRLLAGRSMHTDETSWWVGEPKASLWVFCNRQETYYRVVKSKNRETFYEVIPRKWKGVLVSDCLSVYDKAVKHQQKCYAHHFKAIKQAGEQGGLDEAGSYLDRCRKLLQMAMELRSGWEQRAPPQREEKLRILKVAAQALLGKVRTDRPQEEAVRMRLHRQIEHLFVFLEKPGVEATNNLDERQLRPAVIARNISCGQRTWKRAQAWQVLASLTTTARQTGQSFIDLIASRCSFPAR